MLDRLAFVLRSLRAFCRVRGDLALENLALRQQLAVLSRHHPRPRLTSADRSPPEWHVAVGGVSFDIRAGEIFGLLGPNGAGKTTTIKMLCTLLEPIPTAYALKFPGRSVILASDRGHWSGE